MVCQKALGCAEGTLKNRRENKAKRTGRDRIAAARGAHLRRWKWGVVFLTATVMAAVLVGMILVRGEGSEQTPPGPMKAAIVDQNYANVPNDSFIEQARRYLSDYGFAVDLFQGDEVTVETYRKLPKEGYRLIIFRVHSGMRSNTEESNYGTWLFTSEPYSETRYVSQQRSNRIAKARLEDSDRYPWLFAVGSKFVAGSMDGRFDNTVVIIMGCGPMHLQDMAQAFIEKGASVCLGWDERAGWGYLDDATARLVERLSLRGETVDEAVSTVMAEMGRDPVYGATLEYHPAEAGDRDLGQLLGMPEYPLEQGSQ
ncbi:MAG: hypothetical protein FJZ95_02740 [Chloroflexi bacterium]|nr:hypothetical protein [Chloroflexota bacterium]